MTEAEKQRLTKEKNKMSLRNLYFNRYLLIRYLTAGYFFFNLYWFILLLGYHQPVAILPFVLMVGLIFVTVEQVKQYHVHTNRVPYAQKYYWVQLVINLVLAGICLTPLATTFYPFVRASGMNVIIAILLVGVLGCLLIERKISNIRSNKDRYLSNIKDFQNSIN